MTVFYVFLYMFYHGFKTKDRDSADLAAVISRNSIEPVNEVVLLQVSTAKSDISGHLQQLPHAQRGAEALEKEAA